MTDQARLDSRMRRDTTQHGRLHTRAGYVFTCTLQRVRMMRLLCVVLLCAAAPALGQDNCDAGGIGSGQAAWLLQNTDLSTCGTPLLTLQNNNNFTQDNVENVRMVCTEDCGGDFVDWLRGPECRGQADAELTAFGVADVICAYFNDSAEGSCIFSNSTGRVDDAAVGGILMACATWFLGLSPVCPVECRTALQSAIDGIDCCYNNFYGSETAVEMITEEFINMTMPQSLLPSNLTVNITDPDLLEACDIKNPGICKSILNGGIVMTVSLAVLVASLLSALTIQ